MRFRCDAKVRNRPRNAGEIEGRFRASCPINGRPASLTTWRVTTERRAVADRIHQLYGGPQPGACDEIGEGEWQVFTTASDIKIIVAEPAAFWQERLEWGTDSELVTSVRFRLADAPELGEFAFISGSRSLAGVTEQLAGIDGPADVRLRLVLEYERQGAEAEGAFTQPALELIGTA